MKDKVKRLILEMRELPVSHKASCADIVYAAIATVAGFETGDVKELIHWTQQAMTSTDLDVLRDVVMMGQVPGWGIVRGGVMTQEGVVAWDDPNLGAHLISAFNERGFALDAENPIRDLRMVLGL